MVDYDLQGEWQECQHDELCEHKTLKTIISNKPHGKEDLCIMLWFKILFFVEV